MQCCVGSNNLVFAAVTLRKLFFEILNRSIKRTGSVELFKRNTLSSTTRLSVLFTWHPSPSPSPQQKKKTTKNENKNKTKTSREGFSTLGRTEPLCGFEPREPSQVLSIITEAIDVTRRWKIRTLLLRCFIGLSLMYKSCWFAFHRVKYYWRRYARYWWYFE